MKTHSTSTPTTFPGDAKVSLPLAALHLLGVGLIQSTAMAVMFMLPVLARREFHANKLETLIVTAAPTILFSLSIFWNDYFSRRSLARYLLIYWAIGCLPMALVAFAHSYWQLLVPHLIASVGGAGFHPAAGGLLRSLYPERVRGRMYSILWGGSMVVSALMGYAIGEWLNRDPQAFRLYLPLIAGLQLGGVLIFIWVSHLSGHSGDRVLKGADDRGRLKRLIEPIAHMGQILKADPVFARYEAAYMTYGIGWMICYALLPLLVTDKLNLPYDKVAESTHVAYLAAIVVMLYPAGLLMDRLGAVRSTGLSFALLTIYPVGYMLAGNDRDLLISSVLYGMAHAGASVGWMLGPVSLAPSPDKVPQYVAIHATLVGIRGKIFQGLGVLLYAMLGRFDIPLALAAAAYAWSAVQMWQLHRRMKSTARA
ncbi:MAG: MFS transporter [Phycisphaerae bacterium]|nr:MFS transporter [Phycisphaerae bacterium]